jgi:hypothetical protein
VEFGVEIGEDRGVVGVRRRFFQSLLRNVPPRSGVLRRIISNALGSRPSPGQKLRSRQLIEDGNWEIGGRDLPEG